MKTLCGMDCCESCTRLKECGGCLSSGGHPFGGDCVAAGCILGGKDFSALKEEILKEINALALPGLVVKELYLLNGFFVNLEYPLGNGSSIKLLKNADIYLGCQVEIPGTERCYGVVADERLLVVSTYGAMGVDPELVLYKKR